jgi:hypothetical protein
MQLFSKHDCIRCFEVCSFGSMFCPLWRLHEHTVIKKAYTKEQGVFLVKMFYLTASLITIEREFKVTFECKKTLSAINILVKSLNG